MAVCMESSFGPNWWGHPSSAHAVDDTFGGFRPAPAAKRRFGIDTSSPPTYDPRSCPPQDAPTDVDDYMTWTQASKRSCRSIPAVGTRQQPCMINWGNFKPRWEQWTQPADPLMAKLCNPNHFDRNTLGRRAAIKQCRDGVSVDPRDAKRLRTEDDIVELNLSQQPSTCTDMVLLPSIQLTPMRVPPSLGLCLAAPDNCLVRYVRDTPVVCEPDVWHRTIGSRRSICYEDQSSVVIEELPSDAVIPSDEPQDPAVGTMSMDDIDMELD